MEAAAAAKEAGAKTILIEKEKTINLMRVGLASVGSRAQKAAGVTINKQELVESLAAFAQHNVDQRLWKPGLTTAGQPWTGWKKRSSSHMVPISELKLIMVTIRPTRLSQLKMIRLLTTKALPHMVTGSWNTKKNMGWTSALKLSW